MHKEVRLLNEKEVQEISAGHGGSGTLLFVLGIPHMIIGIIEFTNYVGERIANGCENIEDNDYFAKGICKVYQSLTGVFSS